MRANSVGHMAEIDGMRRYLEAGLALGRITRARAEEAVRDLIQTGELEGTKAQEWVESLISTNLERYEAFVSTVRGEVRKQMSDVALTNLDEIARRVATILEKGQAAARTAAKRTAARPAKKAAPKKAGAKEAASKKAAPKKAGAKKAGAKKAASKKAAPKKAGAKKAGAKKAGAKKAASKKAAPKKAGAKMAASTSKAGA
jgi:polyhydroxyalkanoate synthesis regulator phasin